MFERAFPPIDVIYVEREAESSAAFERARELLSPQTIQIVEDLDAIRRGAVARLTPDQAARQLALGINRGAFVRPFPQGRACAAAPEYFLLHGVGCPLGCAYCFVSGYTDCRVPAVFVNVEDMAREVRALGRKDEPVYIHAGELADPALFEPISGAARALDNALADAPNVTIEYRTKWDDIRPFLGLRSKDNVVMAWTLSPEPVALQFESKAPPPARRIAAATDAARAGFRVGVRLDPVIHFPGWRAAYDELVERIFDNIAVESVADVTLGVLRFSAATESRLRERLGLSGLLAGEFVLAREGKRRYHRRLRVRLYRHIVGRIRARAGRTLLKLSMETDEVREAVLT